MNEESERVMKWQRENPDKFNASKKKYLATSKAKEKHRLLQQKYRQQQKQKIIDLQSQLDIANKKINDYNEMIIKVISECEEMINDRYYMNDTAILKKAELIKGIANHYYIVEPKWIGGNNE